MDNTLHSTLPLIQSYTGFITQDECNEIIESSKPRLKPGMVVGIDGNDIIDYAHRTASTVGISRKEVSPMRDKLFEKIQEVSGVDKSRFEGMTVIRYTVGEEFKVHGDFFHYIGNNNEYTEANNKRCKFGGNRVGTFLLYLNDVEIGGETYFPWLNIKIQPSMGTLVHFKYDYDNWENNIRSQHAGMPVLQGEKWIVTVWYRESSTSIEVLDYKKFKEEADIYRNLNDISYSLEVGPENDRETLSIDLPANNDPSNTIIVGFTGGSDSALLLHLLGALNTHQTIPYRIQPITVTSLLCKSKEKIDEYWENVELMYNLINERLGYSLNKLVYISAPEDAPRELHVKQGLLRFLDTPVTKMYNRFYNYKYIYTGDNALPKGIDFNWSRPGPLRQARPAPEPWRNPFYNLQRYHIYDAIFQLELDYILKNTATCGVQHKDFLEVCENFPCNERRWAYRMINKTSVGIKYFFRKDNDE